MRRYYVDFSTWEINADSEEEAESIALGKIKAGNIPLIKDVCDTEEEEPLEEDLIKSVRLEKMK